MPTRTLKATREAQAPRTVGARSIVVPWTIPFLAGAGLSFLASVASWFLVDREVGLFIGIWVPSILALGALLGASRAGR